MLEIRGLSKSFGGVKATDNVSLDFADGSLTAVIGPNGAGKSTFFNLITGALKPDSGQILLNGIDIAGARRPISSATGIGRAFQVASIFPTFGQLHETMLAAVCADQRRAAVLHRRFPLAETRDRAEQAMELLGLSKQARPYCGDVVGMATRSCFEYRAGAACSKPKVGLLARRAHRRDGHRRALAHDRQGS